MGNQDSFRRSPGVRTRSTIFPYFTDGSGAARKLVSKNAAKVSDADEILPTMQPAHVTIVPQRVKKPFAGGGFP
jgi:glycerol-3-phosphate responsive antiterminator